MSTEQNANLLPAADGQPRQFHLIGDRLATASDEAEGTVCEDAEAKPIVVTSGVSYLLFPADGPPRLIADVPQNESNYVVIEPMMTSRQPYMLATPNRNGQLRINGQPAPSLATLVEKDQLQLDDRYVLHVTILNRPYVGRTPAHYVAQECPVCRVPFAEDTRVFVCPVCGGPMHLQGEETTETDRLECALTVSECPVCQAPIEMSEGYSYQPELYRAS